MDFSGTILGKALNPIAPGIGNFFASSAGNIAGDITGGIAGGIKKSANEPTMVKPKDVKYIAPQFQGYEGKLGTGAQDFMSKLIAQQAAEGSSKFGTQSQDYLTKLQGAQPGAYSNEAASMLQQAAEGRVPSAAENMLRSNAMQIQQQQLGAIKGGGAYNPALARAAMFSGAQAQQQAGMDAGTIRAQEMASARNAYADVLASQENLNEQRRNNYNQSMQASLGLVGEGEKLQADRQKAYNESILNSLGLIGRNDELGSLNTSRANQFNLDTAQGQFNAGKTNADIANMMNQLALDKYRADLGLSGTVFGGLTGGAGAVAASAVGK